MKKYTEFAKKISPVQKDSKGDPSHSYIPANPRRVPQPAPPSKKAPRPAHIVSEEWNDEVKHTSQFAPHPISNTSKPIEKIHPIKNYSSHAHCVQKEIESSSKKISVANPPTSEDQKQDELWRDMMKNPVERHFLIDRITNFFS